jgi:hypothetical protein
MSWFRDPIKHDRPAISEPRPKPPSPPPPPSRSGISDAPASSIWARPDRTQAPPRDNIPTPPIPDPPHCDGVHRPGACQWCDALTGTITALRHQEDRIRRIEAHLGIGERGAQ